MSEKKRNFGPVMGGILNSKTNKLMNSTEVFREMKKEVDEIQEVADYYSGREDAYQEEIKRLEIILLQTAYDIFFNSINEGTIIDTLWHSKHTTLFENMYPHLEIKERDYPRKIKRQILERIKDLGGDINESE